MSTETQAGASSRGARRHGGPRAATARDTLTVTDSRTGQTYELPIDDGTVRATDLRQIKVDADEFGLMSYDPAFMNTASCRSSITYIDGDAGILQHRGYPIEQLCEHSTYLEVAYLLINGQLPNAAELEGWVDEITIHTFVHENIKDFMQGFRYDANPMGMLVASVGALSTFYPDANKINDERIRAIQIIRLLAKMPTLAAFAFRHNMGQPYVYPDNDLELRGQLPGDDVQDDRAQVRARSAAGARARRALHPARRPRTELPRRAPCAASARRRSTRTRRSPPASRRSTARCTAAPTRRCCGCCERIETVENIPGFLEGVKAGNERLMGFGHRVYKNYDPRARIIRKHLDDVFEVRGKNPLLDVATELEKRALDDDYFTSRKLYPNVDFYSGLIYEALGLPVAMFPVMFAIGRTSGWIAQWLEMVAGRRAEDRPPAPDLHRRPRSRLRPARQALSR